jgi:hypothetical protein
VIPLFFQEQRSHTLHDFMNSTSADKDENGRVCLRYRGGDDGTMAAVLLDVEQCRVVQHTLDISDAVRTQLQEMARTSDETSKQGQLLKKIIETMRTCDRRIALTDVRVNETIPAERFEFKPQPHWTRVEDQGNDHRAGDTGK